MVVRFNVFLGSANLICRGTDISKCLRESLGLRDNESRLYMFGLRRTTYRISEKTQFNLLKQIEERADISFDSSFTTDNNKAGGAFWALRLSAEGPLRI